MDIDAIKNNIKANVYHIPKDKKVPLHKHDDVDEIFYCIKGSGFGVTDTKEIALNVGDVFIARAKTLHSVRSDDEMFVAAILIPSV